MKISAVLLAGGKSRRMGEDKALMIVRGKPLWQIQLQLLRRLQPDEIFISARTEPSWRPPDVQFAPDDHPSRGPLSGLSAAMARMRGSHLLALAIDMPFMDAEFLRSLCGKIEPGCGVLSMIGHRAEPLAAIYPIEARPEVAAALSGNDFSLQSLTKKLVGAGRLKAVQLSKEDEVFFQNLNEPTDMRYLSSRTCDRDPVER
jgi:molybdopterin-guanine dinucleotide biosynthesis protein A